MSDETKIEINETKQPDVETKQPETAGEVHPDDSMPWKFGRAKTEPATAV